MRPNNKPITVSFQDVVVNDSLLKFYESNMSKLCAGSFDVVGNNVVIYRYLISGNVGNNNKAAKVIDYYNTHRDQYVAYYKSLCKNYGKLPVTLVNRNSYSNILLKYIAEVAAMAEGFLIDKNPPTPADVLDAVFKSAKVLEKNKDYYAKQHIALDLAGVQLGIQSGDGKPVYDDNFKILCRQFLTFGDVCLLDMDKNTEQAKQIRKLIYDAQKYYEKTFSAQSKAAPKFHNKQVKVPNITARADMKFVKVAQDIKKTSQY